MRLPRSSFIFRLNITRAPGFYNLGQRAVGDVFRAVDVYEPWMLYVVSLNFADGPDFNSYRYLQLRVAADEIQKKTIADTISSFQFHVGKMVEGFRESGVSFLGEAAPETEMWQYRATRANSRPKPGRIVMKRFQATMHRARVSAQFWTMDLFEEERLALGMDWLGSAKFIDEVVVSNKDVAVPGGSIGESTDRK